MEVKSRMAAHVFDDPVFAKEFDCILVGTGLVQSIVAGALAYNGKSVLHLDKNDYYGGDSASLTLDEFTAWAAAHSGSGSCADGFSVTHCAESVAPAAASVTNGHDSDGAAPIDVEPTANESNASITEALSVAAGGAPVAEAAQEAVR